MEAPKMMREALHHMIEKKPRHSHLNREVKTTL